MSANVTIIGNLASDPELRFTKDGKAVCTFTVLTSTSKKNDAGNWESTETTGWRVSVWERVAENCAESLVKGTPVVVYGKAFMESWEKEDGTKGSSLKLNAYNVGVDVKRNPVTINQVSTPSIKDDPWQAPVADDIPPF